MSVVDKLKDWAKANITHLKWGSAGAVGIFSLLAIVLLLFAAERLFGPFLGPLL